MRSYGWQVALGVGLAAICGAGESAFAAPDLSERFEARTYTDAGGKALPYRLLKPKAPEAGRNYPLILFLHGAGERGTDNVKQLVHGARGFATDERMAQYPCFLAAPQCPNGIKWVDTDWGADSHLQPEKPTEPMRLALELVDALRREFPIDEKRIYVAGLSMGGFGTWDALMRRPELFAAGVPVCGGADDTKAALIARIPVWAFHGDQDGVVKTKRSRNIVAALKAAGGSPRYTEYPGVGHDAWNRAFSDPELYTWLFAQRRQ